MRRTTILLAVAALVVAIAAPAGATVTEKTRANIHYATASFNDGMSPLARFSVGLSHVSPGSDSGWAGEIPSRVSATWTGDATCPFFSDSFSDYDLRWSMRDVILGFQTPCGYFEVEWHAIGKPNVDHEWDHYNFFSNGTHWVVNGKSWNADATLTIDGDPSSLVAAPGALIWRQTWSSTTK
jgi:hypothetical protein